MESMDDYKKELDESFDRLKDGDVMSGKVENEETAEELPHRMDRPQLSGKTEPGTAAVPDGPGDDLRLSVPGRTV